MLRPFCLAASAVYRLGYKGHHKLFLRPQPPLRVPVFIVGSYLLGGAGKTPFTIWLVRHCQEQKKKIAVLCHTAAWDEFALLQKELVDLQNKPIATIIATNNRYKTAKEIQNKFDIIICDDGFEDTRFTGAKRFCLDWQEPPHTLASLFPTGKFRSLKQDHDESEIVHLVCSNQNSDAAQAPDVLFSIDSITNFAPGTPLNATVICGLGDPKRFIEDVRAFGINVKKTIVRRDHDKHFQQIVEAELAQNRDIVISQKDACRLPPTLLAHPKLHITIQKTTVSATAQNAIDARLFKHNNAYSQV